MISCNSKLIKITYVFMERLPNLCIKCQIDTVSMITFSERGIQSPYLSQVNNDYLSAVKITTAYKDQFNLFSR